MIPGFDTLGQRWRQQRFNPLRSLTPERLTCAMDSAAAGWVREFALILEEIEKRDAIVRTVLGKRKAAAARQPWDVVISKGEEENPEAQAHKETLEHFYNNLSVTDATDLNVRTGMAGLVRQMMDAVMQRYAVHEIVWQPTPEGMGAELRRVPLYFFENRTGRLRYIGPETRSDGTPLEEDGWMTTVADSVGEAISICYMFRRLSVQDWVAFSEKFSIPGVLGRTSHAKGTAEADAFRDSVAAFGSEWVGVFYNDDGTMKSPIEIIATAAGSTLPQKEMAEYMDRLITALVRGGDLGTLSREDSQGASLQGDETASILADDCAMISETLQTQLDPLVIRLVHGDVKPLAHVEIAPPADEDATREIGIDQALAGLGVRQSAADLAERYGREHVEEVRPTVQAGGTPALLENEAEEPEGLQELRGALAEDLQPLGAALYGAYQAGDAAAMTAALKKISEKMPELAGDASALGEALALRMAEAFVSGGGETPAGNDGNSEGARKGWETRRRNGWRKENRPAGTGQPQKRREVESVELVLDAAFVSVDSRDFAVYQQVPSTAARQIVRATTASAGERPHAKPAPDLTGWQRILEADKVNKILPKHGGDRWPVEEEDFRRLPELLAKPAKQFWEHEPGKTPVLRSEIMDGRKVIVVEEAYTGKNQLTTLSIYRP